MIVPGRIPTPEELLGVAEWHESYGNIADRALWEAARTLLTQRDELRATLTPLLDEPRVALYGDTTCVFCGTSLSYERPHAHESDCPVLRKAVLLGTDVSISEQTTPNTAGPTDDHLVEMMDDNVIHPYVASAIRRVVAERDAARVVLAPILDNPRETPDGYHCKVCGTYMTDDDPANPRDHAAGCAVFRRDELLGRKRLE